MPIRIRWEDDARTVLRFEFSTAWDWPDLYSAIDQGLKMTEGRYAEIDAIFDLVTDAYLPPGNVLFHGRRVLEFQPAEHGCVIILAGKPLLRNVVSILNQVYATNFAIVGTLDEAHALIARARAARSADPAR